MAVQIGKGNFDPSADIVEARDFQSPCTWTSGFTLTNSPEATNIFTGTYVIKNTAANGLVEYKFWSSSSLGTRRRQPHF